jgi:hypothetical protein
MPAVRNSRIQLSSSQGRWSGSWCPAQRSAVVADIHERASRTLTTTTRSSASR